MPHAATHLAFQTKETEVKIERGSERVEDMISLECTVKWSSLIIAFCVCVALRAWLVVPCTVPTCTLSRGAQIRGTTRTEFDNQWSERGWKDGG